VAQIGTTPAATIARSFAQAFPYLLSAMDQFCQVQRVMDLACCGRFYASQGHSGRFGTGVDFQHGDLHGTLNPGSIFQSDSKRDHAMPDSAVFPEEPTRSFLRTGHQRMFAFVEHKDRHDRCLSFLPPKEAPLRGW